MKILAYTALLLAALSAAGCADFLDAKPSKSIVVPESLQDLEAILDNMGVMNNTPVMAILASDDAHTNEQGFASFQSEWFRKGHTWQEDAFVGLESVSDWQLPHQQVFYANIVLEQARKFRPSAAGDEQTLRRLVGEARFKRAYAAFYLLQVFTPPFDPEKATTDAGLAIRTDPNVNEFPPRPPLSENYALVLSDLAEALELLPASSAVLTKPSKRAAHAFLSRVHLSMGDFERALVHADAALADGYTLLGFEEIHDGLSFPLPSFFFPLPRLGSEILYFDRVLSASFMFNANYFSDPALVAALAPHDLRRDLFHFYNASTGVHNFIGNQTGDFRRFGGIGVTELLLARAECLARRGEAEAALSILNEIGLSRSLKADFVPIGPGEDIVGTVLAERRKELVGQGYIRWMDLRRLSREEKYNRVVRREFGGIAYSLDLRASRFHFPVPPVETNLNPMAR